MAQCYALPVADLVNFSSFSPEEEKAFVPYEAATRNRARLAAKWGAAVAVGLLIVMTAINLSMYSPCTKFCAHAPSVCKDADGAKFMEVCDTQCKQLSAQSGLSIVRDVKNEETKETETKTEAVSGVEFVTYLEGCSFSGGAGTTCEGVTKKAAELGLWCLEK